MLVWSYVPAACRDSSSMDLSVQERRAAEPQSHTNTLCSLLQNLHHIRGMFSGRFLCADGTPQSSARSSSGRSISGFKLHYSLVPHETNLVAAGRLWTTKQLNPKSGGSWEIPGNEPNRPSISGWITAMVRSIWIPSSQIQNLIHDIIKSTGDKRRSRTGACRRTGYIMEIPMMTLSGFLTLPWVQCVFCVQEPAVCAFPSETTPIKSVMTFPRFWLLFH